MISTNPVPTPFTSPELAVSAFSMAPRHMTMAQVEAALSEQQRELSPGCDVFGSTDGWIYDVSMGVS